MCFRSSFKAPHSRGLESTSSSDSESSSRSDSDSESAAEEPPKCPGSSSIKAEVLLLHGRHNRRGFFRLFFKPRCLLNSAPVQQRNMLIGSWGTGSDPVSRTATLKVTAVRLPLRARGRPPHGAPRRRRSPAGRQNLGKNSPRMREKSRLGQPSPRPPAV